MHNLNTFYSQASPPTLNHYTNAAGLFGILSTKSLWATHIRYLNDAREFIHAVDIAMAYVQRLHEVNSSQISKSLLVNLICMLDSMPGNTYVISFSETGDLLSQWRGYCPTGGYSLAFDQGALLQLTDTQRFVFTKCSYDRIEQEELIQNLIDTAIEQFQIYTVPSNFLEPMSEEDRANVFVGHWFFPKMQRLGSAMKDPAFSEEREWRLIGGLYKPSPQVHLRPRGSLLVPYEVLRLEVGRPFDGVVTGVTIGPNSQQALAEFGLERLRQCGIVENLNVEKSNVPYRAG